MRFPNNNSWFPCYPVVLACLCAALTVPGVRAQSTAGAARVAVDARERLGPVNRFVFGHNIEAGDPTGIFKGNGTQPLSIRNGTGFWNPVAREPVPSVLRECRELGVSILRYPGGSLANNYDWRKAVGPVADRGGWQFGIDEYITLCRQMGAEPLFTASDYVLPAEEMPAHNAALVEYLNAPATPDHPWAMKRKGWGRPEPYGVKWFELGNESSGGNADVQPRRQFTPEGYARYAIDCIHAMKAVDPSIKIGIVTAILVQDPYCEWNQKVIGLAGPVADFVTVHQYAPTPGPNASIDQEDRLMRACMATADQYERMLGDYHGVILKVLGHDLPLAITEFNGGGETQEPKPYRFSYGVALECADLMRAFLKPENKVVMANYWQLLNGYFGAIRTDYNRPDGGTLTELALPPLYRLWGQHFGADLVDVKITGPTAPFEGMGGTLPARGKTYRSAGPAAPAGVKHAADPAVLNGAGFATAWTGDDALSITLTDFASDAYPLLGTVAPPAGKAAGNCDYRLTFEARYVPDASAAGAQVVTLGLELVDSRGWNATGSIAQVRGITEAGWKSFSSEPFHTLGDAPAITLNAILAAGPHRMAGRLEVRNLKLEAMGKITFPEYALLTGSASLSAKGDTLFLVVFNKSEREPIATHVSLASFPAASARLWQVNAPGLASMEGVKQVVGGASLPCAKDGFDYTFPAHSMTAVELSR